MSVILKDLERQKVRVILPGFEEERDLFLMGVEANTSTLEDFKTTFAGKVTMTDLLVATKVFGDNESKNKYGVFVDQEHKMIFAFNLRFGDYDKEKRMVVYKTVQEILLKAPLIKALEDRHKTDPLMETKVVFEKEEAEKIFEKMNSEICIEQRKLDYESFRAQQRAEKIFLD